MKDIKQILAENLVNLRKKNNLTQQELAEKLNYSDNTVSRWEHAEVCPSVETLEQISEIYNVPVEMLLKENIIKQTKEGQKKTNIGVLVTCLLVISLILFGASVAFFYCKSFLNLNLWVLFVWAVPASLLVLFWDAIFTKKRTFIFVVLTLFIWTFLTAFYVQFLSYNLWLIFTLGIPAQLAWTVWCYVMPKKYRKFKKSEKQTTSESK